MLLKKERHYRWRKSFALFPVSISETHDIWLEWYEWRPSKKENHSWGSLADIRLPESNEVYTIRYGRVD